MDKDYFLMQDRIKQIETSFIEDGKYQLAKNEKYFEIKKGRIFKILTETKYVNPENQEIYIQQQDSWKLKNGDYVFMCGQQVDNDVINFSKSKNLVVRNGKVVRLERKKPFYKMVIKNLEVNLGIL